MRSLATQTGRAAPRDDVLAAATKTAAGLSAAALVLRIGWTALSDSASVSSLTLLPATPADGAAHFAAGTAVAVSVYFARGVCNELVPSLRESSDAANSTILPELATTDVLIISMLSGLSEEYFFRGALMPSISPDFRGCCIAAAVFGSLHITGGRNAAVAVWATFVGALYGALALATGDIASAAVAHVSCNFLSGVAWKRRQLEENQEGDDALESDAE